MVLSILSAALTSLVFQRIKFANFYIRSNASLPLAKAARLEAFYERKEDPSPDYDTLEELKRERSKVLCNNISYKYYFVDKKNMPEKEKFIDESGLININLASKEVLKRLPGLDEDLAEGIVHSSRRPFRLKEEVLLVEGLDKDRFEQFKDLITVYGEGRININTVSGEVLSVLGLDDDLIRKIMRYRQEYEGPDGKSATDDDGAFTNPANVLSDLRRWTDLTLRQEQDLLSLMNILGVKSPILRLDIVPQIKGKAGLDYTIVIRPQNNKVILWQEE